MIIEKLIKYTSNYIGRDIKDVIITIPSYFNSLQRETTKLAVQIYDINVIRIVNKETSFCFIYRLYNDKMDENILIFHMGSN